MQLDIKATVKNLKQLQNDIMSTKTQNYDEKYRLFADLEQIIWITKSKLDHAVIFKTLLNHGLYTHVEFDHEKH